MQRSRYSPSGSHLNPRHNTQYFPSHCDRLHNFLCTWTRLPLAVVVLFLAETRLIVDCLLYCLALSGEGPIKAVIVAAKTNMHFESKFR
jgi:hypothetical protein